MPAPDMMAHDVPAIGTIVRQPAHGLRGRRMETGTWSFYRGCSGKS